MLIRRLLASAALAAALASGPAFAQTTTTETTTVYYTVSGAQYLLVPAASADQKLAYRAVSPSVDMNRGMWGAQPIQPPAGLVMASASDFVGRTVYDGSGTAFGTVREVLVDPRSGLVHYALVSTPEIGGTLYPVPMSAIELPSMKIGMAASDIRLIDDYSLSALEQRYPRAALNVPIVFAPVAMVPVRTVVTTTTAGPGVASGSSSTVITTPPYRISQAGDWVGRAVMDPSGEMIGVVDYLLTDPGTGAVRQAAVSGGSIGRDSYVLIPSANLRVVQGRLVADQTLPALLTGPRLEQAELIQRYGPVVARQ